MTQPTTMQIRKAVRKAATKVGVRLRGRPSYTDKRANGCSRVSILMYGVDRAQAEKLAKKANKRLKKKGLDPVVKAEFSGVVYSYMKINGTGVRA